MKQLLLCGSRYLSLHTLDGDQPISGWHQAQDIGIAPCCQAIFDFRRHLRIRGSQHNAIGLHGLQLLPKHLLRDGRYGSFQVGESHYLSPKQVEQDHQLPPSFEKAQRFLQVSARKGTQSFSRTIQHIELQWGDLRIDPLTS
jgi:hypothetical protein